MKDQTMSKRVFSVSFSNVCCLKLKNLQEVHFLVPISGQSQYA